MTRSDDLKAIPGASGAGEAVRSLADDTRAFILTDDGGAFAGLLTRESVLAWLGGVAALKA
jgi:hypothetical protein